MRTAYLNCDRVARLMLPHLDEMEAVVNDALEHVRGAAGSGTSAKQFKSGNAAQVAGILVLSRCLSESMASGENMEAINALQGDLTRNEFMGARPSP